MPELNSSIEILDKMIEENSGSADLYFQRGKLKWKMGDKPAAMSDFSNAVILDPESPAKGYLEMANDIMDFYNTDLYNP